MSRGVGIRQLGALAVRIIGLLSLLRAVTHVPALVATFGYRPSQFDGDYRYIIAASIIGWLLQLVIAWLFLSGAEAIASKVFPEGEAPALAVTAEECLAVALAAVGAYVAANALPRLGEGIINFKYMRDTGSVAVSGSWIRGNWVALTGSVALLVVGIGLFVKSRYLASAWSGFEARPRPDPGGADDDPPLSR